MSVGRPARLDQRNPHTGGAMKTPRILCLLVACFAWACSEDATSPQLDDPTLQASAESSAQSSNKQPITAFPFWARGPNCCLGEWGGIYFYQNPDDIPTDFNLLTFFDARALGSELAVQGYGIFDVPSAPRFTRFRERDKVEFWFFPPAVMESILADGVATVSELLANDPIVGFAHRFREVTTPILGGAPVFTLRTNARGRLADGGTFRVRWREEFDPTTNEGVFAGRIVLRRR